MQGADFRGWAPGHSTTVIDLEERTGILTTQPASSSSSHRYYALDTSADGCRSKKRKIERACDFCRKRKTKCDGPKMQGNLCTNCIQNSRSCTYLEGSKPRGPPKAYVTGLEDRVEKMEALLRRLRPEADFSVDLGPPVIRDSWKSDSSAIHAVFERPSALTKPSSVSITRNRIIPAPLPYPSCPYSDVETRPTDKNSNSPQPRGLNFFTHLPEPTHNAAASAGSPSTDDYESSDSVSSDGEDVEDALIEGMKHLSVTWLKPRDGPKQVMESQWRFHGKSSLFRLIAPTRGFKQQHMDELARANTSQELWRPELADTSRASSHRRPQYWKTLPWEIAWEGLESPSVIPEFLTTTFPPMDLAEHLIETFFRRKNNLFPLLHRPTFERQWREGLYRSDTWFSCMCMGVFGVASRYSDDPRVLCKVPEGQPEDQEQAWAGWKYISVAMEVHRQRRSVFLPVDLFEVQTFVLLALWLRGSGAHAESWTHISIGIRKAQDVGAHRRKVYGRKPTVEEELWKRAYWHLVTIDRIGSMLIGRPCASREEDLDLDLPLEVDDEYWEHGDPEVAFQQPCSKPAQVTAFVCWIKLSQIAAFALRTLYALGTSKEPLGLVGQGWREEVVAQVNDALTDWVDSLPEHLRYSPTMEDPCFAKQAALLLSGYYLLQITVYRPFIPVPRGISRDSFRRDRRYDSPEAGDFPLSALSICVNAAKAGTQLLEVQVQLQGAVTNVIHFSFVFAGVLLVNLWTQIAKEDAQTANYMYRIYLPLKEDIMRVKRLLEDLAPGWSLAREASQDIGNSLPPYPSHHDLRSEHDVIPLDNVGPGQHRSAGPSQRHAPPYDVPNGAPYSHSRASSSLLVADFGTFPLYNSAYNNDPPSLLAPYDEAPQLWTVSDVPSRPHRFIAPELHSAHDEWFRDQPQVPLRHTRSTSHVRSTYADSTYNADHTHGYVHSDTGVLPSGEIVLRDPSTMGGLALSTHRQEPYIKREVPDDGQPMHLFPVEYRQGPSSAPSEYIALPEMLTRQAPTLNSEQTWSRSNYRYEQWRVHGYSS